MTPTATAAAAPLVADKDRKEKFDRVALSALRESDDNPRRYFDAEDLKKLAENIRQVGILEPLVVRPLAGEKYEIVCGARRYRAAKIAELGEVPVVVRDYTDDQVLQVMISENLQRQDLAALDEAEGYSHVIAKRKLTAEQLAGQLGKSVSYVYMRMKLCDLIAPAKELMRKEKDFTVSHAEKTSRLTTALQQEALKWLVAEEEIESDDEDAMGYSSVRVKSIRSYTEYLAWLAHNVQLDLAKAPWKKDDAALVPAAGPCSTCHKRAGFSPNLFPDLAKQPNTCTDRDCYRAKLRAFAERVFEAARKEDRGAVKLSEEYGSRGDLRGRDKYDEIKSKKKCVGTHLGVFFDGRRFAQKTLVCVQRGSCKVHGAYHYESSAVSSKRAAAERAREKKRHREMKVRRAVLRALYEKVKTLKRTDWELIAHEFYGDVWHERRKMLADLLGVKDDGYRHTSIRKAIAKLDNRNVVGFVLACALSGDVHISSYGWNGRGNLDAACRRHDVNAKAVAKELDAKKDAAVAKLDAAVQNSAKTKKGARRGKK